MIPGDFDANGTHDLMWYRARDGLMRFYTVTPTGRFTPMTPVMYGNQGWDRIPSGDFDANGRDDLMYYRSSDGLYRFYTISATGRFSPISEVGHTTTGWDQILAGQFDSGAGADLVLYKPGSIQAAGFSPTSLVAITKLVSAPASQTLTVLDWSPYDPPVVTTTTAPIPPNPGDTKNCSDFDTQAEAQAWFDYYYPHYGDIAKLDADNNLIPCESLP